MRLYDIQGRLVKKPVDKYLIDWEKKSRSIIQFKVKQFLKPFWNTMVIFEEFPCFGSQLKVDILNATLKIAIEVNGNQHETFNPFFHNNNPANFLKGIKNDSKKMDWLLKNNFRLFEIYENEIGLLSKEFFIEKFNFQL